MLAEPVHGTADLIERDVIALVIDTGEAVDLKVEEIVKRGSSGGHGDYEYE